MKSQPFATNWRVVFPLFISSAIFALPAYSATCSSSNLPTGPTAYVATSPNLVTVLDASNNTVACTITVGAHPTNLAVSPDGSQLFVENDADASISVVDLSAGTVTSTIALTTSGVTAPMTANLAVSPDGTFVYVVSLPQTLAATTTANLTVIRLPSLDDSAGTGFNTSASNVAVTGPGLGVAFTPDGTAAYISTEGLSYVVTGGASPAISSTISVSGGTVAVAPNGDFAYVVSEAPSTNAVSKITIPGNAVATFNPSPACGRAGTVAITPDSKYAYYTCLNAGAVQAIDAGSNAVATTVPGTAFPTSSPSPAGIAISSDGAFAYVTDLARGVHVTAIASNSVAANAPGPGAMYAIAFRPVQLSITPGSTHLGAGQSVTFTSTLRYAFGTSVSKSVSCAAGGAACGTIDSAGNYTAPGSIPSPNDVKVIAKSTEIPVRSLLYPSQSVAAPVAVDPVLVFKSSPITVTAGTCSSTQLTVESQDGSGNPVNVASDTAVTLVSTSSGGAFSTSPSCSPTTMIVTIPSGNADVSLFYTDIKAGSPTITASTTAAGFTGNATQMETVIPADASALVVSGYPSPVTAGTTNTVTVTAEDTHGNVVTGYTGTVHFSSSDAQAVVPANYTFVAGDSGMHSFNLTLMTAASQSITVTDTVTATITGTQSSITVNPAGASTLVVSGYASPVTAGTSNNFTVTAKDSFGNTATAYTGTVRFTSSDAQVVVPTNYTFAAGDSGMHSFNLTLKTAATQSITATDTATATIIGTQSGITVNPAGASTLVVSGYASPVTAGTSNNFTVTAKDSFGNTATGYTGTVRFTSSDAQAVVPANYMFVAGDSGMRSFNLTLKTAATQSITATDTATATITGTQSGITVNPAGASTLAVSGYPSPVTSPAMNNLTVTAEDINGNTATGYTGTVRFTSSDAQAVLSANYTFVAGDAGMHSFPVTLKTAGSQSITVTDTGTPTITGTQPAITVKPGAASTLVVSGYPSPVTSPAMNSVTVTAEDINGNTATGYTGTVRFTSGDAQAVLPANYTFVAGDAGMHSFPVTLNTAGSQSITVTDTGTPTITGTQPGITVKPGAASTLVFTTPPTSGALGGNKTALSAVAVAVKDGSGNTVANSTASITIALSAPANLVAPTAATVQADGATGTAVFDKLYVSTAGTYTLTATATLSNGTASVMSNQFTLTSSISATITSSFTSVNIEDLPAGKDTFAALANGDPNSPSLGVKWAMLSCGGSTSNLTLCGSIDPSTGAYAPPTKVPLKSGNTFVVQATANADPGKSSSPFTVTMGSTITVSVTSTFTSVKIEDLPAGTDTFTATADPDPNAPKLGVTWTMTSCGESTSNLTLCGSIDPNSGVYTPPNAVPYTGNSLTGNTFSVQATSKADPNKTSAPVTITIGSNIVVGAPMVLTPASGTVVFGAVTTAAATVTDSNTNPNVSKSVTWTINCLAGSNLCGSIDSQGNYSAPTAPPSPATFTLTATSIADRAITATTAVPLSMVPDLLVAPPNAAVAIHAATSNSASVTLNLFGPNSAEQGTFVLSCTIQVASGTLTSGTCVPTPSVIQAQEDGKNPITFTLSALTGSAVPAGRPTQPRPSTFLGLPIVVGFAVIAIVLLSLRQRASANVKPALMFVLLLCLVVGWVSACNQFSPPGQLPKLVGATQNASGTLTMTARVTGGSGVTPPPVTVPFTVSQ